MKIPSSISINITIIGMAKSISRFLLHRLQLRQSRVLLPHTLLCWVRLGYSLVLYTALKYLDKTAALPHRTSEICQPIRGAFS